MREQYGGVVCRNSMEYIQELMKGNTLFQYTHTTHTLRDQRWRSPWARHNIGPV